ncbi:MAG: hypothetical protein GX029_12460, partial [Pseudomonadaceae bacterium]|nr:hypothetical protein [Pseudomonadaceae bacterium]
LDQFAGVAIAIGNNVIRYEKLQQLREHGALLPAIIHPQAVISRYAHIGEASVVCAGPGTLLENRSYSKLANDFIEVFF